MNKVYLLDSTLRDGAQSVGISFSVQDKIKIARILDELQVDYIEAGNPGSNPKDVAFFEAARRLDFRHARLAAFGSTRRVGVRPEDVEVTSNPDGLELVIDVVEELGADAYIYGTPTDKSIAIEGSGDDALAKPFIARVDGRQVPEKGAKVFVHPKAAHLHVFNKETGERLTS